MPVDREHPACIQPQNPDIRIWRYMNFAKYVSLIKDSALYFPQLKILAKNDPYKGTTTRQEFNKIEHGDKIAINSKKYRLIGLFTKYSRTKWVVNAIQ